MSVEPAPLPIDKELRGDHPWVERYRLPVVYGTYPSRFYFVTLSVPDENPTYRCDTMIPTEEEARILGSFTAFTVDKQGFRGWYLKKIQSEPLDVDSGYNTLSFEKRITGNWAYRRSTFRDGTWPNWQEEKQFSDLVELLDHIEQYFPDRWNAWKAEHNIVSGLA